MTTITALPAAPDPDDGQAAFDAAAEAFVAALATFISETNTVAGEVNTNATDAATDAALAENWATSLSVVSGGLYGARKYANDASSSASAASSSASAASASAASAVAAPGTNATSTSSLTIGTGSQSLTIETGKSLVVGASVKIARTSEPTKWMAGDITAYNSGTGALTVNATTINGSGGPYTDWTVSLSAALPSALAVTTSFLTQATAKLLGRSTAGTGAIEEIGLSGLTLSAGTLSVTNPAGLVLLDTKAPSSAATVDFTTGIDSTYDEYEIHLINVVPATDGAALWLRVSTDGGSTFDAGASDYGTVTMNATTSAVSAGGTVTTSISMIGAVISNTASAGGVSGVIKIFAPADSVHTHALYSVMAADDASGSLQVRTGAGSRLTTTAVNAVRILFSTGNVAAGKLKLYGVRKS